MLYDFHVDMLHNFYVDGTKLNDFLGNPIYLFTQQEKDEMWYYLWDF